MVDYSKWDNFEYSDDDDDQQQTGTPTQEKLDQLQAEDASITADRHGMLVELKARAVGHIDKWKAEEALMAQADNASSEKTSNELQMRRSFTSDDGALLAEWVTTNHYWAPHVDCCFRYEALIRICTTHPTLMEDSDRWVDVLLSIARSIAQSSDTKVVADARMFYVAINTLVASHKYGGVVKLMEMICTPKDEEARAIRRRFVAQEFMKEAYMKHVLGPVDFDDEDLTQRGICPQNCTIL
jgi:hypothetical protein